MSGLLCYSLPDSKAVIRKFGEWKEESIDDNTFFVSDFNKNKSYFFVEKEKSSSYSFNLSKLNKVAVDSKDTYLSKVHKFINFCKEDPSRKVVLSRNVWTPIAIENSESIFKNLVTAYPSAFVYLINSKKFGCWIGATPEKLLRGKSNILSTMSLAGSRAVNNPFDWTEKERKEQVIVTDYISEVLNKNKLSFNKSECATVRAGNVEHLSTEFVFQLNNRSAIDLAAQLHPTPAVSGLPKKEAIDFINSSEGYDRKLYTGIIGWSSVKETELFVNLRCAQIFSNGILSYVGGGITKDSDPEQEWLETEFKSQTLLSVIQKM